MISSRIVMLEERRSDMRARLISIMAEGSATCTTCTKASTNSQSRQLENILKKRSPLGIRIKSVSKVVDMMWKVCENPDYTDKAALTCGHTKLRSRTDFMEEIDDMKKEASLCLDCVLSGTLSCRGHEADSSDNENSS